MDIEIDVLNYYNSKGEPVSKEEYFKEKKVFSEYLEIRYRSKIKEILDAIPFDFNNVQKMEIVYQYLVNKIEYDYETLDSINEKGLVQPVSHLFWNKWGIGSHEKYTPIVLNRGISIGIAAAFQDICTMLKIDCDFVQGKTKQIGDTVLKHTWNKVVIDEKKLNIDITYGIFNRDKNNDAMAFFLISDDELKKIGPHHDFEEQKVNLKK